MKRNPWPWSLQVDTYVYEAFQFFDVDQDGFLSMEELLTYLGRCDGAGASGGGRRVGCASLS